MQKNNEALREYANHLESLLEKCCREHGGNMDTSYLRLRPKDDSLPAEGPSQFQAIAENPDATSVLLVDDVDVSHYNPDFDWSRHLPSNVHLDRKSHDEFVPCLFF
jgi:hypothetical protein